MSTIRVIYTAEPRFPATDQHPDAVRYQLGPKQWVDAIGGQPTQAEVDAVLNPPAPPAPVTTDFQALHDRINELQAAVKGLNAMIAMGNS